MEFLVLACPLVAVGPEVGQALVLVEPALDVACFLVVAEQGLARWVLVRPAWVLELVLVSGLLGPGAVDLGRAAVSRWVHHQRHWVN